jgi:hypothetical protein
MPSVGLSGNAQASGESELRQAEENKQAGQFA